MQYACISETVCTAPQHEARKIVFCCWFQTQDSPSDVCFKTHFRRYLKVRLDPANEDPNTFFKGACIDSASLVFKVPAAHWWWEVDFCGQKHYIMWEAQYWTGWWFGTWIWLFHHIGKIHPNWLSLHHFSEGWLNPQAVSLSFGDEEPYHRLLVMGVGFFVGSEARDWSGDGSKFEPHDTHILASGNLT